MSANQQNRFGFQLTKKEYALKTNNWREKDVLCNYQSLNHTRTNKNQSNLCTCARFHGVFSFFFFLSHASSEIMFVLPFAIFIWWVFEVRVLTSQANEYNWIIYLFWKVCNRTIIKMYDAEGAGQSRAERADKRQGDYRTLNSFIIIKWKNEGEKRFYVKIVLSLSFLLFCVHKKIVWIDAEMRNGLNVATAADATLKFIDLRFTEHEWKRASKGKTTKILSLLWIYRAGCKLSSCQAFSSFFFDFVCMLLFFLSPIL